MTEYTQAAQGLTLRPERELSPADADAVLAGQLAARGVIPETEQVMRTMSDGDIARFWAKFHQQRDRLRQMFGTEKIRELAGQFPHLVK